MKITIDRQVDGVQDEKIFMYRITYLYGKDERVQQAYIQAKSQISAKRKFWLAHGQNCCPIVGIKKFSLVEV